MGGGWGKKPKKNHSRENGKKKNSCREGKEKKFMQKEGPIVTSESLSFRNQQYYQAQYE